MRSAKINIELDEVGNFIIWSSGEFDGVHLESAKHTVPAGDKALLKSIGATSLLLAVRKLTRPIVTCQATQELEARTGKQFVA